MAPCAPLTCRNENKDQIFYEWKKDFSRRSKLSELINIKIPKIMMRHAINTIKRFAEWKHKENEKREFVKIAQRQILIKIALKKKIRKLKQFGLIEWQKHTQKCARLKALFARKTKDLSRYAFQDWRKMTKFKKEHEKNLQLFHDNMDKLSLQVEKNVLYDVGGEIQRILEEHHIYKMTNQNLDHSLYEEVEKMLRVIIDRVKEIEEGGFTSMFDTSGDNFITTTLSHINSKSKTNGKLFLESNILK